MNFDEERVSIPNDDIALEGVLAYPTEGMPTLAVLVFGPHPHLGGTMNNNVVSYLARAIAGRGGISLRFNYRGVGESGIVLPAETSAFDYYDCLERERRYAELLPDCAASYAFLRTLAPNACTVLMGYSLGAILAYMLAEDDPGLRVIAVSPPVCKVDLWNHVHACAPGVVVGGDADFAFNPERCAEVFGMTPGVALVQLSGCDHFYRAQESRILGAIEPWLMGEM